MCVPTTSDICLVAIREQDSLVASTRLCLETFSKGEPIHFLSNSPPEASKDFPFNEGNGIGYLLIVLNDFFS